MRLPEMKAKYMGWSEGCKWYALL